MITSFTKRASEVRRIVVDFRDKLGAEELLTGTPTVAEVTTSALTISDKELTTSPTDPAGWFFVPTDKGVQFLVAGGVAGSSYTIRVTIGTDSTDAQTLIREITLRVI